LAVVIVGVARELLFCAIPPVPEDSCKADRSGLGYSQIGAMAS
jgi:hypothetical protein